ncbi:tape measure protein [Chroococcidiopsis sp.]|uniref:tape measure protein n=1 Tax=Chroococcidiopsis sp. TaxID=3088168 RepID=UPI003F3C5DDD
MASVGSVELELRLSRTAFDKELRSLSSLEIPPLNLDLKLDAKSLNKQLKDLKSGDYGCLELQICPDIKGLSRKLKELPKSLVDCISIEICPELDTESLKKQFEAIKNDFSLSIQTAINAAVKVSAVSESKQGEAANRGADKASEKIEAGFGKAADKINEAIDTSLKNAAGAIAAPFTSVFRGFFEGIGQNLSRELSNGAIRTFQKTLDVSFKGVGGQAGGYAAKEVGKALGLKPIPKPRTKKDDDESGGATTTKPRSPKPSSPDSGLSKELKSIAIELGTFADIMRRAGLGGDKFGSSALGAAKEALELAATFEGLRQAIVAKKAATVSTVRASPNATPQEKSSDVVQADTLAQTAKRGFLKGDVTKVTKEQAKAQVEKVRSRLEKDLAELQALPESAQTTKKIESLLNKITQLQSRIALDIANPEIPKAVRQSLGQLKSTQSKLAETQRNIEATAAKSISNRKLPGIAKAAAGGLGATLLGGGSAFAAPTGGGAGLGALGALPFDPTLGLAAGGIAAAFAAAKFTPRLLRKVGAQKAADVLETDVGAIAVDAIKGVFGSVRTSLKNSFQSFGTKFKKFVGLNDPIKDRELEEKKLLRTFTNLDINLRRDRPSDRSLPLPRPSINTSVKGQSASLAAPPVPNNYWERFFRGLEARFYRSPVFSGVAPKNRRNLTSEATGFLTSGALLTAPGATTAALGAPLIAALTPLITTVGLVANAIGPLVGTIANTLKQIEPLQKRFEFVGGGKEQGAAQQQFVRGVASDLNIPVLSSLQQFSKLAAAARKTKLEGEPLKELFTGIATGAKALQLNAEDLNLVMFAFTQVLSKGKLSAEEVRLQIAERLPGAVGIFARAMGVTEAEFNKLLESGSLLAEDVLPKVGRQLKLEYGDAAQGASNTFLSSLTKVENAMFKLQEGFANSLGPALTVVTNAFAGVLDFFANNAKTVFSTSAVVLTGVAAQFFVGLTQILEASGLVGKLTGFLSPLFGRLFATLTPFAVGILADFLDDIFGAQTSVMENLMQGSYKSVLGLILVFNDLKNAIGDFFSSLGENEALSGVIGGIANAFGKLGEGLSFVRKFLSGTVIEFTSLSLILAQTYVLLRQGLNLVLARLGTTIAELSTSFIASVRSGKVFSSTLSTLTAGLARSELAAVGATAAFVLFFSKADFSNELGSKFDELGDRVTANFERISQSVKKTQKDLDDLKPPEIKSKGFDLTLGLGESVGLENIRTDDIIKQFRNDRNQKQNIGQNLLRYGPLGALFSIPQVNDKFKNPTTIGEKQFNDNIIKQAQNIIQPGNNLAAQIFSGFDTTEAGKSLAAIKRFDEAIAGSQKRRQELLSGPDANTDEVKRQVTDLDEVVSALLKKREELSKPIADYRDSLLDNAKVFQEALKIINDRTDLDEGAKQRLREPLLNAISITDKAIAKLKEMGGIDLSPLGNQFAEVTAQIDKSDTRLERTLGLVGLNTTKRLTKTANDLAKGTITPDVAARENTDTELADLRIRGRSLDGFVKARKESIKQLQAVPAPTAEQIETIDKYQKEVESKEMELAQNRLQTANKITEGKKQAEGRILKDFQIANAQAAAIVQKAEAARIERTKRRQLSGAITDEQSAIEISSAGVSAAKADLTIAQDALVEFRKIKKTGKVSAEEIATRELELNKQVSDAIVRSLDAEIAKRDSLKQKRIADIEEIRTKEQSGIDTARTNAANRIKQQQLAGTITPDGATNATTEAEIAAAIGTLAIARKRLDDIKKLRAEGTLNAKEAAQKERDAIASVATAEGQILDLRLQKQQQFREQNLRRIEEANNRAIALIQSDQSQADIAVIRRQLDSPRNEESDRASERAIAFNAAEATRKKIVQAQKEISQLSRANFETEAEYIAKRTELNNNLTSLVKEGLEQQLQKQRQVQEDAIRAIEQRVDAQKNQSDLAVQGLEDEKAALDLLNSSLDRSKQLLESRSSLNKAIADAKVINAEIALEQGDETQKQQLSVNLQNAKLEALKQEQQTARDLLDLDLKRQKISAQMAISEAEIAQSRALIARLEAVGELQKAQRNSDNQAIAAAQTRLDLQDKIVASTDKQLQNAKDNLSIQDELAANATKTLSVQQQSALAQANAAKAAALQSKTTESIAPSVQPVEKPVDSPELSTDKKPKKLSLFEQSRLNMFAPLPTNKNVGLPPEYFNLKATTQKATTSSTGSSNAGTSAEAELNALSGLQPGESVENLLKRQLGLDLNESVENYLKKPMSLFFGQDRNGTLEGLNQKYAPKANSLQQLQEMYKPKANSLQQLQEMYKTDAKSFEELNQKYAPKESTSAQFTDSLKMANKDVVDRLDKLNQTLATAINSPRSLYVSSPEPVTDAVSILADINRMNIQSSGLG